VFGGPSDPTAGFSCGAGHTLTELLEARCDDDACALDTMSPPDDNGYIHLTIVGNRPGDTVLHLRARVDDGSEMQDDQPVSFVTATGLHVACDATVTGESLMRPPLGQCGGHYPVFTGSGWRWVVTFDSDDGPVGVSELAVAVSSADAGGTDLAAASDGGRVTFHAGVTTGTAQVTLSSRLLTRTIPVRTVSVDDVVAGELRVVHPSDGIDADLAPGPPLPSTLWYVDDEYRLYDGDTGDLLIQPLLTLADGAQVFGGGGVFVSDQPNVVMVFPPKGGSPLSQTWIELWAWNAGKVNLTATIGGAHIAWPVDVVNHLHMP